MRRSRYEYEAMVGRSSVNLRYVLSMRRRRGTNLRVKLSLWASNTRHLLR